jgi:hypothetical protein
VLWDDKGDDADPHRPTRGLTQYNSVDFGTPLT